MNAVPVSVALVAGGLAVINPCGFPLLPAFLSFYLGAEDELPHAPTRILQGLLVGALVSAGFLGLFALASLPVSFGVALVARAIPWAGLATGALLALAGLLALSGRRIALPLHLNIPVKRERRLGAMLLFGVGYGAASLGCTLPLFLTLIAASSGADKLTVFAAYAAGTAVVLMAQTRQHAIKGVQGMQDVAGRSGHSHVPNAYDGGAIVPYPRQGSQAVILAKMV